MKVAEPNPDGSEISVFNTRECVAVEGDHRRALCRFRAEYIAPPTHPQLIGRGRVVLPEPAVGKGEEIGLVTIICHCLYYTNALIFPVDIFRYLRHYVRR